ncbi:uncharacterized protein L201_002523 [Kwoniella dendrophila CBS 6074]|uniref:Uncharacterized protein n=1 Tax=Kwoniella dendrophila CBS 6074 TaxID=1295534 RepID=A0AAX4JRW3_9TREE
MPVNDSQDDHVTRIHPSHSAPSLSDNDTLLSATTSQGGIESTERSTVSPDSIPLTDFTRPGRSYFSPAHRVSTHNNPYRPRAFNGSTTDPYTLGRDLEDMQRALASLSGSMGTDRQANQQSSDADPMGSNQAGTRNHNGSKHSTAARVAAAIAGTVGCIAFSPCFVADCVLGPIHKGTEACADAGCACCIANCATAMGEDD